MIVKEVKPGYIFTRKYFDLSDSEKERIKEICEELRLIFNADSVGIVQPDLTLSPNYGFSFSNKIEWRQNNDTNNRRHS